MAMARWLGAALVAALGASCGGAPPASTSSAGAPANAAPRVAPAPAAPPGEAVTAGSAEAAPEPPPPAPNAPAAAAPPEPPAPAIPFPPPTFTPPHERTAKPGDGAWTPLPEGTTEKPPVLAKTTVHPHKIKPFVYVHVVAIDLGRAELRLVAGTQEPVTKSVPPERRPGLVPAADQADLLAVFNGGFMARHGRYGMMVDGDVFLPPRPDVCTVALYRDGAVRIGPWPALEASAPEMVAYRQTPPCMAQGGVLHEAIDDATRPRKWSAAENGEVEIRRSALGVDASGKVLFYGSGEWVTAKDLATAMTAAGAVDVAQLDINYSYTKFLMYGRPTAEAPLQAVWALIPDTKHTKLGYVSKAAERDFFYVRRRAGAGAAAPR